LDIHLAIFISIWFPVVFVEPGRASIDSLVSNAQYYEVVSGPEPEKDLDLKIFPCKSLCEDLAHNYPT
jgi:hypothetical protein